MAGGFEASEFAREFQRFVTDMNRLIPARSSPVRQLLIEHLGRDPDDLPVLSEPLEAAEHPNVQLALDEMAAGGGWRIVGLSLGLRQYAAFSLGALATDRMADWGYPSPRPMPVEYVNLPIGPDDSLPCAQLALYLGNWQGTPLAVLVMAGDERSHFESRLTLEVLAPQQRAARELLDHVSRRRRALNVYRGQALSFAFTPHGRFRLDFLRMTPIERTQVVLPEADLVAIEEHTIGISAHAEALRASGRHIKRGILLYGPPGTGKTWSVTYLRSRMAERTTVVINGGPGIGGLGQAVALARSLQPSMVVVEDVDLIAQERTMPGEGTTPLLFQLLNEMDGLGEDADVIFVLTTNRVDLLEPALAMRPGRIDQAVEIGLPDEDCRARLFELYLRDLPTLDADIDLAPLIAATHGVSAAFIKELTRRAVLLAAVESGDQTTAPTVAARHLTQALAALDSAAAPIRRTLLGAQPTT